MLTAHDVARLINSPDYQQRAYRRWSSLLGRERLGEVERLVDRFGAAKTLEHIGAMFHPGETIEASEPMWVLAAFLKWLERHHTAPHN